MKISDYVVDFIVKQGVFHIFEMAGGAIAHLLDSTYDREDIHCVAVHHEQAAAFAAEGYARINGKLGVAMATSGPGALNLLTGIGSCYFDSVPCLFITGQVNTYEYKFDKPVRQIGFQETDIISVAKPLVKYAEMITDAHKIRYHLEKAVYMAKAGRPGPVLLDIPMNVQRTVVEPDKLESYFASSEYNHIRSVHESFAMESFDEVLKLVKESKRPVILAGGGIRTGGATPDLRAFVDRTGIPVVTSLMGVDAIPGDHSACFGLIGSYGNRYSNLALANSDLVLIFGSRLDTRQTGTRPDTFARAAKKVHVDIDLDELNQKVQADIAIRCNIKFFLAEINKKMRRWKKQDLSDWYTVLHMYKGKYPTGKPSFSSDSIDPNRFMELLSEKCVRGDVVCLDVGQHQMWASQTFRLKEGQRLLNCGGMGAMGFALPAALGAAKAAPGSRIIVIAGDGGFQVNIQELDTIVSHKLPIKIIVMNNNNLGMVRQFQDLYFNGRQQSTVSGYSCPNLCRIAEAYGLTSYMIDSWETAVAVLEEALKQEGPVLIEVKLEQNTFVNPKLVVNRPIEDMSPHLDREQLKKDMLVDLVDDWKENE